MTLREELEMLRKENQELKRLIEHHGVKRRTIEIKETDMFRLFGVDCVDNKIVTDVQYPKAKDNFDTFKANILRVVFPYARGNKNSWIGYKPFIYMTDHEFEVAKKLIETAIAACLEAKDELEDT